MKLERQKGRARDMTIASKRKRGSFEGVTKKGKQRERERGKKNQMRELSESEREAPLHV